MKNPVYVTRPYLPDLDDFTKYLEQIWENKHLTNDGPFHRQLEKELAEFLGVKYVSLFANGSLALITALQALRISGEVITTPFSFVATTHAIWWNNIKPIFCDIEPNTYTLDPKKIEACITPHTTAVLPVHVYGYPCNIAEIEEIASKHGLKVIYDAAHAFNVKVDNNSVLNFGDLSVLSFHATKIYNTFEGGAIISHDEKTKKRIDFLKNHGFADEVTVVTPGINSKMNEVQAAMGLLQLKNIESRIDKLKIISQIYRKHLKNIPGITLLEDIEGVKHNYAYMPVLFDKDICGVGRDEIYHDLKERNIYTRRYFYPLISHFPAYKGLPSAAEANLPVAEDIALKVLCLPNFADLEISDVEFICDFIRSKLQTENKTMLKSDFVKL